MTPEQLHGQRVAVLGLGESGLAMLRWCVTHGAHAVALDTRPQPPGLQAAQALVGADRVFAAAWDGEVLKAPAQAAMQDISVVAISPGIAPHDARFASLLQGRTVLRELDCFMGALAQHHAKGGRRMRVAAVTGTNGKTTVTRLTEFLLRAAGVDALAAGNVSPAMLDAWLERAQQDRLPQAWVLELSSFQLHGVQGFAPEAATVLNLTQDHLDWHGNMQAYLDDKMRIAGADTWFVYNRNDATLSLRVTQDAERLTQQSRKPPKRPSKVPSAALGNDAQATVTQTEVDIPHMTASFGLDAPQRLGDFGLVQEAGVTWLAQAVEADLPEPGAQNPGTSVSARPRRSARTGGVEATAFRLKRLMPADTLKIRGSHNQANALAALMLAQRLTHDIPQALARMLRALPQYAGEPHRTQWVATVRGVDYVDDSKGTNVGATVAALMGLDTPCWLIAGGLGKGQDFAPLAPAVQLRCRGVLLIGKDAPVIEAALRDTGAALLPCADLPQAVSVAAQRARAGEIVLLSPACASQDMFRDYKHRAEVFVEAVQALSQQASAQEQSVHSNLPEEMAHA